MEPRIEKQKSRFRIERLEERIAPAHLRFQVDVPPAAAEGAHHVNENSPGGHTGPIFTFTFEDRKPGRVFE